MKREEKVEIKIEIVKKIDRTSEDILGSIQKLVRIPSIVGQEGRAQEWIANLYRSIGLYVTTVVPQKDELIKHPAYSDTGLPYDDSRPNIIGVLPSKGAGKSLILNGHMDVVSPEPIETWNLGGPWSGHIEGNRLYGRGQQI